MTKTENAVSWIRQIAADNSHGYLYGGWGPDWDCGHLIIDAWEQAGVPVKSSGRASFTGDMKRAFLKCGFKDVTAQVNLKTGAGTQAGDVLLNEKNHAAMCVGDGKIVQARTNLDGKSGDSSGQEIREQAYYNYNPWDCVLRYAGDNSTGSGDEIPIKDEPPAGDTFTLSFTVLRYGAGMGAQKELRERVRAVQRNLKSLGFNIGRYGLDGEFGNDTKAAVLAYQRSVGLAATGEADRKTMAKLNGM